MGRKVRAALALAIGALLVVAGCAANTGGGIDRLRIMVPNVPGGGYDVTTRTAVSIAERSGLGDRIAVFNLAGAQGMVALLRLLDEEGNGRLAMMMGLGVVGASIATGSPHRVTDGTPIARLLLEPEAVLVPADSPYRNVGEFVDAWRADPAGLAFGGGSAVGGPDHLMTMQLARAVGLEPRAVDYGTFDGGGELLPALLDGRIDVAVSSLVEYTEQIRSGQLRVLAVSGAHRVAGIDAPTLTENGIDLVATNWRGVIAPPGISAADRDALVELFRDLERTPEWQDALDQNSWTSAFLAGDDFAAFLQSEDVRVRDTLAELGLG